MLKTYPESTSDTTVGVRRFSLVKGHDAFFHKLAILKDFFQRWEDIWKLAMNMTLGGVVHIGIYAPLKYLMVVRWLSRCGTCCSRQVNIFTTVGY
jgi:hypothetical protein